MVERVICPKFKDCNSGSCVHKISHYEAHACISGFCNRVDQYVRCLHISELSEEDRLSLAMEDL